MRSDINEGKEEKITPQEDKSTTMVVNIDHFSSKNARKFTGSSYSLYIFAAFLCVI